MHVVVAILGLVFGLIFFAAAIWFIFIGTMIGLVIWGVYALYQWDKRERERQTQRAAEVAKMDELERAKRTELLETHGKLKEEWDRVWDEQHAIRRFADQQLSLNPPRSNDTGANSRTP